MLLSKNLWAKIKEIFMPRGRKKKVDPLDVMEGSIEVKTEPKQELIKLVNPIEWIAQDFVEQSILGVAIVSALFQTIFEKVFQES